MRPDLILINPWIYDFAAYDLWSKPLGLMLLGGALRARGFRIHLIDCLDPGRPLPRDQPGLKKPTRRRYGTGKYWRQELSKPPVLKHVPRPYSRYGMPPATLKRELEEIRNPSAVLVTSLMTYWYPGVRDTIRVVRSVHPGVPIILGGVYARLCTEHAREHVDADHVSTATHSRAVVDVLKGWGIRAPEPPSPVAAHPVFDLLGRPRYICLQTSHGCPYRCPYCASPFLNPRHWRKDPQDVLREIIHWHERFGVIDFAFYDDALLFDSESHLIPLLEKLASRALNLRFHTPNALHVRGMTPDIARLMHRTGFCTIRLGLESWDSSFHRRLGGKVREGEFAQTMDHLLGAGFTSRQIGAYILVGLPGQSPRSVEQTVEAAVRAGAAPYLAEYSPIPHTELWDDALAHSPYDLTREPLFHNNTLVPCWDPSRQEALVRLKRRVVDLRRRLSG